MALATSPGLLLLDEPLSALDARVRLRLRHEIKALQRRLGVTTIMVTHDQEEALTMADRIVVMNQGAIEQVGTPQQIYRQGIPAAAAAIKNKFGKALQGLVASDQDAALLALQTGQLDMSPVPASAFFSQVLNDTKQGYFADPIYGGNKDMGAWKMIGFPGAHYDYKEWVSRHGERVPYPTVGFKGRPGWTEGS